MSQEQSSEPLEDLSNTQNAENESAVPEPTKQMLLAHRLTLVGYWGLVLLIPVWNLWWYPSEIFSNKVVTIFWLIPLVFPMFGLLKGKAYTHAWSGFIAVIYFCHGFATLITSDNEYIPIALEIIFSSMFLFGGMYFARWRGIQLGLQLPKKK
jgi:uncharacterized membrane protein